MSATTRLINKPLKDKLVELIRLRGPLTVSEYMKLVLANPDDGFYMKNDVFGVKGHFTTSPEISQTFGEVLSAWILQEWRRFNCPKPLRLVEFGPGRGTLMADLTRTIRSLGLRDEDEDSLEIQLIEVSPHLKEMQKEALSNLDGKLLEKTRWFSHIDLVERNQPGYTAFIAHEFLDALPIHKFVRDPASKSWRELLIDYNEQEELRFCISRKASLSSKLLVPANFQGEHLEVCPEAALTLQKVADRLNSSGQGCALVCDYGFEEEICGKLEEASGRVVTSGRPVTFNRDTFRAFKRHEAWPALQTPGTADLTADVDFGYLKKHLSERSVVFGSVEQGEFLVRCGIESRLERLLLGAGEHEDREELISGVEMLTGAMGRRYRFMAMFPSGSGRMFAGDPPAGFDPIKAD